MKIWLLKDFSPTLTKFWVLVAPQKSRVASSITRPVWQKKSLSWDQTGELTIFNWEKLFCGDIIFPTAHTLLVVFELRCSSPPKSLYVHPNRWDIIKLICFPHENMKKLQHTLQPKLLFKSTANRSRTVQIPKSVP